MKNFLFTTLLLISGIVYAENCSQIGDYKAMVDCEYLESIKADDQLNKLYQSQMKKLGGDKKSLAYYKQNQRDWLKYARNYCDAKSLAFGDTELGSFYPTSFNACFSALSKQRINELQGFECEEGDMSSTCIMHRK